MEASRLGWWVSGWGAYKSLVVKKVGDAQTD